MATTSTPTTSSPKLTKKPQPIPWTHEETVNLIKAYQEKWYSLKRGQLRANQWEEVAVVVAARCGYDFNHPSKSAIQCRHKIEKLRQRYRALKHRLSASSGAAGWQYFALMDELERGPLPISARPLVSFMPFNYDDDDDDDDDEDEEEEEEEEEEDEDKDDDDDDDERENYIKSRSINYILNQRSTTTTYGGVSKGLWRVSEEDDDDDDDGDEVGVVVNEMGLVSGLTAEIKAFAERFIGMENLKMKMMKETERFRLKMENKRIEMILESRQRIVDSIGRAFGSSKRMKMSHEI